MGSTLLLPAMRNRLFPWIPARSRLCSATTSRRSCRVGLLYAIPDLIANTSNGTVLLGMTNFSLPPSYYLEQWNPATGTFTALSAPGVSAWTRIDWCALATEQKSWWLIMVVIKIWLSMMRPAIHSLPAECLRRAKSWAWLRARRQSNSQSSAQARSLSWTPI